VRGLNARKSSFNKFLVNDFKSMSYRGFANCFRPLDQYLLMRQNIAVADELNTA